MHRKDANLRHMLPEFPSFFELPTPSCQIKHGGSQFTHSGPPHNPTAMNSGTNVTGRAPDGVVEVRKLTFSPLTVCDT